jgi:adenylyltransferase/sulfurtransferase
MSEDERVDDAIGGSGELSPSELAAMIAAGTPMQLVDIREPWEAAIVSLDGSELIPLGMLGHSLDRLREDVPVVLYCHHGVRSAQALAALRGLGHDNVLHLGGGIEAWADDIDPSLARY